MILQPRYDTLGVRQVNSAATQLATLVELDARHDDLLRRLEELDNRVSNVLAQFQPAKVDGGGDRPPTTGADPGGPTC
jgi:hypothetical protein